MRKYLVKFSVALCLLGLAAASAEPDRVRLGLSVSADAGIAPLLFINQDALGFDLYIPVGGPWALEAETQAGFTVMVYPEYGAMSYPPDPMINAFYWFFVGQELGAGFPLRLGEDDSAVASLRIKPLVLGAIWSPFYYSLFGAGASLELEYRDKKTGALLRPFGLTAKVDYRPSSLAFKAVFRLVGRFTILW
jgi:hypothetical protein